MQRLKYAFRFNIASFSLAFSNTGMKMSWLYWALGNLLILILWIFPLMLLVSTLGLNPLGISLIGLTCLLTVVSLLAWCEIAAIFTCQNLASLIQHASHEFPSHHQKNSYTAYWGDVALWFIALPGLQFIHAIQQRIKSSSDAPQAWMDAHYLVLPVISLERIALTQAVERVKQIVNENLVRINANLVGVRLLAGIVQWFLVVLGMGVGFVVFVMFTDSYTAGLSRLMLGTVTGLVLGGGLISLGCSFSCYTRACYHTALYKWVQNVEDARHTGDPNRAAPPEILKQVLGMFSLSKKER